MKTLIVLLLILVPSMMFGQVWFQASMEHKFNQDAGLSVSNEVGYNVIAEKFVIVSPSIDYTYFVGGDLKTQNMLFECITITAPIVNYNGLIPYVSSTIGHLNTFPTIENNAPGNSGVGVSHQAGFTYDISKTAQFFYQYRYFNYPQTDGFLTQFGVSFIIGG